MRYFDAPNNQCFLFPPDKNSNDGSVIVVGKQIIRKGESYPLEGFPETALFSDSGGRCISNYQLIFIAEGSGSFRDRGISYGVSPGSMILIKPGVWHSYAPSKETGWTEYYVGFIGDIFTRVISDGFQQGGGMRHIAQAERITGIFEKMIEYARADSGDVGFLLKSILMLIISETVFSGGTIPQDSGSGFSMLSKARNYMEEHVSDKINLSELAGELGVSYSTFKNTFKELTGLAPVIFLKQMRIRKSKYLLSTTGKSVKAIGLECGFSSSEYFCNCFREETGLTPLEFREQFNLETVVSKAEKRFFE